MVVLRSICTVLLVPEPILLNPVQWKTWCKHVQCQFASVKWTLVCHIITLPCLKQTEIAEMLQHSCCAVHEQIIITAAIVFLRMFDFSVQRASFFAAADENHRPVSAASSSDQAEDQLTAQIKPYTG